MSDDEADPELLALLRQSLGLGPNSSTAPPSTGVLRSAEYICDNAIDVAISTEGTKTAAETIWHLMQQKHYSTETWSSHELHPQTKDEATVNFIFTMNLLNFSFWSELQSDKRYAVEYKGRTWTGYWSLVAALQRALDEGPYHPPPPCLPVRSSGKTILTGTLLLLGHPITTPDFWQDLDACPDTLLEHIFRSATPEAIPLLAERISILREAGTILYHDFDCSPAKLVMAADKNAVALVNLLVEHFPNFRDTAQYHGRQVQLYKRAQILVADLWACFNGTSYGAFDDISSLTMFADYRIPQMLQGLRCLWYSPRLETRIARLEPLGAGALMEVEIRGCSIWCVDLIRREIERRHPEAKGKVNAVLIDYFLYDTCKEMEARGELDDMLPHHRTRSIFY